MSIKKYLSNFENCQRINLVGPFCSPQQTIEEPVIFIDSGAHYRNSDEGISVGDGDSFDGPMDIPLNPEKDFSDLSFALGNIPENFSEVNLIGFLGGRRDHELINIGESHHFLNSRKSPTTVRFGNDVFGYSSGNWQFDRSGSFSVSVIEETFVTLTGNCVYTCPRKTRFSPLSSLGLSNTGNGTVYISCDGPVFVLFENV